MSKDAHWYWQGQAYASEHYRYSPVFYWLTAPLRALPFEGFLGVWVALHLGTIAWLGPWTILLAFDDVIRGNIGTFIAAVVVLAVNGHSWTWATVLLTKVTPGVGVLYHVGRRQWRAASIAVGLTAGLVGFGLLLDTRFWMEWFGSLGASATNYQTIDVLAPLPVRLAAGAILCLASARWVWLLPVGILVALPGLWLSSAAVLAAIPRLRRARAEQTEA